MIERQKQANQNKTPKKQTKGGCIFKEGQNAGYKVKDILHLFHPFFMYAQPHRNAAGARLAPQNTHNQTDHTTDNKKHQQGDQNNGIRSNEGEHLTHPGNDGSQNLPEYP